MTALSRYPEIVEQAALEPRAARAGALSARPCEHLAHLLQRRAVHRRGRCPAQCAPGAGAGRAAGDAQRPRRSSACPRPRRCRARPGQRRSPAGISSARAAAACARSGALARIRPGARGGSVAVADRARSGRTTATRSVAHRSPPNVPRPEPRRATRMPPRATAKTGARTTTSTTCCPSSKWWCRRRTRRRARARHAPAKIERPGVYVLQAGSYRQQAEADRIRAQLQAAGHRRQRAARGGGRRRVASRAHRPDHRSHRTQPPARAAARGGYRRAGDPRRRIASARRAHARLAALAGTLVIAGCATRAAASHAARQRRPATPAARRPSIPASPSPPSAT